MKTFMTTLLCTMVSSAMAAESAPGANADHAVADEIEVVTLPNGEVVTRLVSRSGITARQFWVNSVYGNQQSVVVFQGESDIVQGAAATRSAHPGERQTSRTDPAPHDVSDLFTQGLDGR